MLIVISGEILRASESLGEPLKNFEIFRDFVVLRDFVKVFGTLTKSAIVN
ncbi:hypothetical protein HMPREF9073_01150 [Capnocytophaga sp. oral taxon 326 str. F0382]|nr:hypothetical protein HMPREF9073_01150 [Capnocytophaga sp. oral taxon 326 str. F0382]